MDTERWQDALDDLVEHIRDCFARSDSVQRAREYLIGLLSDTERKNAWQLAETLGHSSPYALQQFLYRMRWAADDVRDALRAYVAERLGAPGAIFVLDETGFVKKGDKSVGVQRQYCPTVGKIENCQIGVFLTYASAAGHTFLDRELYLPKSWTEDRERMDEAGVPEEIEFATKPQLALRMIDRALGAGVPGSWVTADQVYGDASQLRERLEAEPIGYVLAISGQPNIEVDGEERRIESQLERLPQNGGWTRLSVGDGSKGQRVYDWRRVELSEPARSGWERWLLVRRSTDEPTDLTAYLCFAPVGTSLTKLAKVAARRWTIEQCFEEAKGETGLDEYEVRSWDGWYKHITMSCLAHAFLAVTRAEEPEVAAEVKKKASEAGQPGSLADFKASRGLSSD